MFCIYIKDKYKSYHKTIQNRPEDSYIYTYTLSNQFIKYSDTIIPAVFTGKPFSVWYDDASNAHVVDPGKNRYVILPADPGTTFQTVFIDGFNNIWYGTDNESRANMGLTRLTETPRYFHHYITGKDREGNLNPVFAITKDSERNTTLLNIHNIVKDKNEIIISGTGIFRFNPINGSLIQEYTYPPGLSAFSFIKNGNDNDLAGLDYSIVISFDSEMKETGRDSIQKNRFFVEHVCRGDSTDLWLALMGGGIGSYQIRNRKK